MIVCFPFQTDCYDFCIFCIIVVTDLYVWTPSLHSLTRTPDELKYLVIGIHRVLVRVIFSG
jgi:hypothetical protein